MDKRNLCLTAQVQTFAWYCIIPSATYLPTGFNKDQHICSQSWTNDIESCWKLRKLTALEWICQRLKRVPRIFVALGCFDSYKIIDTWIGV